MHHTATKKTQKKPLTAKKAVKKVPLKKIAKRTLTTLKGSSQQHSFLQQPQQQQVFNITPFTQIQRSIKTTVTPSLVTKKFTSPLTTLSKTFASFPMLKKSMLTTAMRHFHPGNERLNGVVKWFDAAKGFGFITNPATGADLFVHFTSINTNGYRNLVEGQSVEYTIGSTSKGPAAVDVVPFEKNAV